MKNARRAISFLPAFLLIVALSAQSTFPYNGVYDQREGWYAFTNATIVSQANQEMPNATMVIKEGQITALGQRVAIPDGAVVIDLEGQYIYPSFIDLYSAYGIPEAKPVGERPDQLPQMTSNKEGAYAWNEALKPEFRAHEHFSVDGRAAKALRQEGFGVVASHQMDGISRGTSTVVALGDNPVHELILQEVAAHHLSFRKGVSTQTYPTSLMGTIALLRQTYLDGQWYDGQDEEVNISLGAWNGVQELTQVFEVDDWQSAMRALRIAEEFGHSYIIKGGGDEYQRLDDIQATAATFILPLDFPEAYDVADPYDALQVSLADMRHWELAPTNPGRLAAAGIPFALTAHGLEKPSEFRAALRKAIQHGLSEEDALRAITEVPAQILGLSDEIGTLAVGKHANFLITSGPIFADKVTIHHNWILGEPFVIKALSDVDLDGEYRLLVGASSYNLTVADGSAKIAVDDSTSIKVRHSYDNGLISLSFMPEGSDQLIRLSGVVQDQNWQGRGQLTDGDWVNWEARYAGPIESEGENNGGEHGDDDREYVSQMTYPFGAYGHSELPQAGAVLIRNATVWTNEDDGILENADVLLQDGTISAIGTPGSPIRPPRGATIVDGTGKHLTPGIIDEHTHIGVSRGVNESSQASSAEVRIGDVINSTDVNMYRQLAGGVTTAQVLHGSANPIGGQSAIIKFRWGYLPEALKFEDAPGFIKFALGENVKQSNRSNDYRSRYPQSRMGVEQLFENYFTRAREYGEQLAAGMDVRRDLDLEAVLEILNEERFITCHSYQQGEINMLMEVAERFDFRINTFTHILEGYKVADKMAEHGVGGSSFSDWWAYKYEVVEAIPHNGALMHEQGVTVAFNSDDAEMARRLNQEAAKAVLFGGVSEEDALKFVTLNPARLLQIDDRVGSIRVGKDADVVLWTDHPLSIYARAEQTYVDGIKFYDMADDQAMRDAIQEERNALVQRMLQAKEGGANTQRPGGRGSRLYHCDTYEDEGH